MGISFSLQSKNSMVTKEALLISSSTNEMNNFVNSQQDVKNCDTIEAIPWSEFQEWALKDNLPRYMVNIANNDATFALWRTMCNEVTELGGYDISFLRQKMYVMQASTSDDKVLEVPNVLPLLDQFKFEKD